MPIKNLFKASLAGAALFALSVTGASPAPDIPCGTAELIVAWGAGGGPDIIGSWWWNRHHLSSNSR
mgnify:CR=1 FL=1